MHFFLKNKKKSLKKKKPVSFSALFRNFKTNRGSSFSFQLQLKLDAAKKTELGCSFTRAERLCCLPWAGGEEEGGTGGSLADSSNQTSTPLVGSACTSLSFRSKSDIKIFRVALTCTLVQKERKKKKRSEWFSEKSLEPQAHKHKRGTKIQLFPPSNHWTHSTTHAHSSAPQAPQRLTRENKRPCIGCQLMLPSGQEKGSCDRSSNTPPPLSSPETGSSKRRRRPLTQTERWKVSRTRSPALTVSWHKARPLNGSNSFNLASFRFYVLKQRWVFPASKLSCVCERFVLMVIKHLPSTFHSRYFLQWSSYHQMLKMHRHTHTRTDMYTHLWTQKAQEADTWRSQISQITALEITPTCCLWVCSNFHTSLSQPSSVFCSVSCLKHIHWHKERGNSPSVF